MTLVNSAPHIAAITPFHVMSILQRARELEQQGRSILHLEIGEPDFPAPKPVIQAGLKYLEKGQIKYTPAAGLPELRERIAAYYHYRYGLNVAPSRIIITPGASGALLLAMGASLRAGDEVLVTDPGYPCHANTARLLQAVPRTITTGPDSDYHFNAALIAEHWQEATRAVVIASPANPTGSVIAPRALRETLEAVKARGGICYADEIYHGLVYGGEVTSALHYDEEVFVINSFSKYFGMTGWRVGWLVAPESLTETVERLAQNLFIAAPSHSQYAALAAFHKDTLIELEQRRQEFEKRRDFLRQALLDIGFTLAAQPDGAFYLYVDASRFTDDTMAFARELLEREGVALTPGIDFGTHNARHHLRFAYTVSIEKLIKAVNRLKRFVGHKT